ncbi:MAG: hypothetical protein Q8P92_02240 [Candidatus Daviesbacteria bacterium]|nr:hypothetical protein [Candidatus Daviesbacteria bacterium]
MNKLTLIILGIILVLHVFILTKLIFFPYPEQFIYPYLVNSGLKPYSQILDQHFPGLMLLPINFNNLGMTTPDIARIWLISVVLLTQLLLFFVSGKILQDDKKALLVNILYLIWQPFFEGWVLWVDSFLPLMLLPAAYFLHKQKYGLLGLLLGLVIIFKQVMIPLGAIIALYIFWENKKLTNVKNYLLGLSVPLSLMVIYLISIEVFKDFLFWTITFNLTTYAQLGRGAGPTLAHLFRAVLVFGTPFIILLKIKERTSQILLIFLIGSLMGLFTRFDFVHFQPALPFALIGTVMGFSVIFKNLGGKVLILLYILVLVWWLNIFYQGHISNQVLFFDKNTYEVAEKIMQYTDPGDKIFILGSPLHLYQMTQTLPAGDIFVFQFPWFLQVTQSQILDGIKEDQPEITVVDRSVEIEDKRLTDFASEINKYLQENYIKIDMVGTAEILKRKI